MIYYVANALASLCMLRHIGVLEELMFYFMRLFIGHIMKVNLRLGGLGGVIISSYIMVIYCCEGPPPESLNKYNSIELDFNKI